MASLSKIDMRWLALPLLFFASLTQAHDRGDRIEHRLDVRGDRINHRLDLRAAHQLALGHPRRAAHLDSKGNRIDRRLDRIGARIDARYDRRHH